VGGFRNEEAVVTPRRELRRAARIVGFGALTAAMLPAFLARQQTVEKEQHAGVRKRWLGAWCAAVLGMFGVRVLVHSSGSNESREPTTRLGALPPLPPERGHLIVANHRSTADILVLLRAFGGHMVSRADVARWPLLGHGARSVGTVFVDRSDAVSGASAVRAIRTLLARASTVIVFAEGTTFTGDEVRPFHAGAFVAALRSGADVVPVGLAYATGSGAAFVNETFGAHLARMAAADPSGVAMCVGEPIAVARDARAGELRDRARAEVQRLVHAARRLVDGA
jgi:1-acyl-sn-glycerol-3-phosphate acyltransferase